jgi:hypothetical protein
MIHRGRLLEDSSIELRERAAEVHRSRGEVGLGQSAMSPQERRPQPFVAITDPPPTRLRSPSTVSSHPQPSWPRPFPWYCRVGTVDAPR